MFDKYNIHPFTIATIKDPAGILKIDCGGDYTGQWQVISVYNDFTVLNRGPRIARVITSYIDIENGKREERTIPVEV